MGPHLQGSTQETSAVPRRPLIIAPERHQAVASGQDVDQGCAWSSQVGGPESLAAFARRGDRGSAARAAIGRAGRPVTTIRRCAKPRPGHGGQRRAVIGSPSRKARRCASEGSLLTGEGPPVASAGNARKCKVGEERPPKTGQGRMEAKRLLGTGSAVIPV